VAGAAFAIAWTPCTGPTLGAILTIAAGQDTARGAALLGVYSAGLAIPFLASATLVGVAEGSLAWFKRHYAAVQVTAGLVLVAMGVLLVTDEMRQLNIQAQHALDNLGLNFFSNL
jgi:cytochrome c-type biogenesis protein